MSTGAAQRLAEKKVRRQKQVLAVGSVVLLAAVGFQLPKLFGGGDPETAPAVTAQAPGTVSSSPTSAAGKLPDTDRVLIQRNADQLLSFGLFESKDPFVQQLSTIDSPPAVTTPSAGAPGTSTIGVGLAPAPTPSGFPPGSGAPSSPTSPEGSAPAPVAPGTTPGAATTPAPTPPAATPTTVLISTNGGCQTVAVNGTFPSNEDIFRLVSIAGDGKSVEIGVVGGSYDTGQAAATLKLGEKLALVNTADGTRYVIALKAKCTPAELSRGAAGSTAGVPTTPAPPAPATTSTATTTTVAPTATTPIVPDPLDTTAPSG